MIDLTWFETGCFIVGWVVGIACTMLLPENVDITKDKGEPLEPFDSEPLPTDKTSKYMLDGK